MIPNLMRAVARQSSILALRRLMAMSRDEDGGSPPEPRDPYAKTPVPTRPRPSRLTGSVAVAEPDDE